MPKVAMEDPLTARKPERSCLFIRSAREGGTTLTSAPVSIRKRRPELALGKNSNGLLMEQNMNRCICVSKTCFLTYTFLKVYYSSSLDLGPITLVFVFNCN